MKMQSLLLKKQEKSAIKGMKYKAFAFLPGFLSDCHSEAYLLSEGSLRHTSTGGEMETRAPGRHPRGSWASPPVQPWELGSQSTGHLPFLPHPLQTVTPKYVTAPMCWDDLMSTVKASKLLKPR